MLPFALNHMTAPTLRYDSLATLAGRCGCIGVELRNDLGRALFDGADPADVREALEAAGIRLLALADIAVACGAEAISLIPRNDGHRTESVQVRADLTTTLEALRPILRARGLIGLIEPLGFATCGLRHKADAVAVIDAIGAGDIFKLIHDTFHHHLAGGGAIFAAHTGLVHVSGVTDPSLKPAQMCDAHRGHVDADDNLGNLLQIKTLQVAGYAGPISVEAFSPDVHALTDPAAALSGSFNFITSHLLRNAA
ncbi:MAG: hypothetical protein GKR99_07330 [Rhodobacteraceae bacterium]|nr:hypothetical protein [Paracoccaceae bacterium]